MNNRGIGQQEYLALQELLCERQGIVLAAYAGALVPRALLFPRDKELARKIESLAQAGILNERLYLDDGWRAALDDVVAGQSIERLSGDKIKRVVDAWCRQRPA
jgi:hypothetical protein